MFIARIIKKAVFSVLVAGAAIKLLDIYKKKSKLREEREKASK